MNPLLNNLPYGLMSGVRDIEELFEIRRILELAKIEAAIEKLTDAQLTAFDAVLEGIHEKALRGEVFPDEDRDFHRLLFEGLDNRMLNKLIDVFWVGLSNAAQSLGMTDPDPLLNYRNHQAIVNALRARDVDEAKVALDVHYDGIRDRLAQIERG